eukprot:TRINITY_DN5477_c0_g1_i2.p1 TRINITY_DN5477_c0_g1~~TRINITY_DN5477_c0_g1_i2.p1  ORF type:complete len:408 (-),score=47.07 TRINITY_DN5477_c0_g1_i2:52-1275(-)
MRRPRAWLTGCLGCCSSGRCGGFMPNYSGISPDHRLTTSGARCLVAKLRLGSGAGADAAAAASSAPTAAATAPTAEDLAAALNSARPAYRTFMEQAIARLEGAMELLPYSVPEGMEGKGAVVGKGRNQQQVKMTVAAYSAAKFRHIRAALVETSGPTQVLNFVIFPDPSLDLPIFGADLVSLPGAHLICIDLQPPADPAQYPQPLRHVEGLAALAAHAQTRLPWGGDLPPAAQRFFSPHCIWSKVGDVEVVETAALDAMLAYLDHYLAMAAAAEPVQENKRPRARHADALLWHRVGGRRHIARPFRPRSQGRQRRCVPGPRARTAGGDGSRTLEHCCSFCTSTAYFQGYKGQFLPGHHRDPVRHRSRAFKGAVQLVCLRSLDSVAPLMLLKPAAHLQLTRRVCTHLR